MKKSGFTLAEVLITLMILGVIAALTIPSLIQNTQKKEQIVQLKKGISMINQAVALNYSLQQKDLSSCTDTASIIKILRDRLSVTNYDEASGYVQTQDGLTYYINWKSKCKDGEIFDSENAEVSNNICADIVISTLPGALDDASTFATANGKVSTGLGDLSGYYAFKAGTDRVVPTPKTAELLFAKDATSSN